jgi:hypothetical protein
MATRYGLDGPGIETGGVRDFPPTQSPVQRVYGHSRGKSGRDVALICHTHLTPRLKKE